MTLHKLPPMTIILHSPENPGNVGAVARAMKNFGFTKLALLTPQCDHRCDEARNRAKHAQEILEEAIVLATEEEAGRFLSSFDLLVATSGKLGSEYNIPRLPVTPKQLHTALGDKKGAVAILFGRESHGLTNEELKQADLLVTIPASEAYPILNLSHAVTVLLYELANPAAEAALEAKYPLAKPRQREEVTKLFDELLASLEFATAEKEETQRLVLRRLLAFMTAREAQSLLGLLKKIMNK